MPKAAHTFIYLGTRKKPSSRKIRHSKKCICFFLFFQLYTAWKSENGIKMMDPNSLFENTCMLTRKPVYKLHQFSKNLWKVWGSLLTYYSCVNDISMEKHKLKSQFTLCSLIKNALVKIRNEYHLYISKHRGFFFVEKECIY